MKTKLAMSLGSIACCAGFLMAGCSDDTEPQTSDGTDTTSGDGTIVTPTVPGADQVPATGTPVTTPGTTPVTTPTPVTPDPGAAPPAGSPTPVAPVAEPGMPIGGGVSIIPDPTGWVQGDTNVVGIQGAWYGYNDCNDSPADCTLNHVPAEGAFDNIDGTMCTSGTTAAVAEEAEFGTKWGAGIALDLNALGGELGGKSPWDATANGVTGFSFDITFNVESEVRVNMPTPATEIASHFYTVTTGGTHTVTWADVSQGSWIKLPDRTDFDPSGILALQFQIPSKMMETVPFDFCVSNLTALQ